MEQQINISANLEIKLRTAMNLDKGFVYELMRNHLQSYFDKYTRERWSRIKFKEKFNPKQIKIIEHDGMSIGFFEYYQKENYIYFTHLHISQDYQGRYIGNEIFKLVKEEATSKDLSIKCKVFKENKRSLKLLEINGFKETGKIPEEDSLIMEFKTIK